MTRPYWFPLATDLHQWSGTPTNMASSLGTNGAYVHYVGNLKERYELAMKGRQYFTKKVLGQNYFRQRSLTITAGYAKQVQQRLSDIPADIVLSPSTIPICRLESEKPIVIWTDATFAGMIDFYPDFSNLHPSTVVDGNRVEQDALNRCALAIYSSDWAAKSAVDHYNVDPAKVKVVPFGANLDSMLTADQVRKAIAARPESACKLLFIGVDWPRKGGDVALEVVNELNRQGIKAELTVVGCAPESAEALPDYVKALGFVSKSSPKGQQRMMQLLAESHFLIIPSRADCTPIVLNEANALGVPCLTTDVGGIPSVISNNVNGYTFALDTDYREYVDYISGLMRPYRQYKELANSAFDEYQRRLNWTVSGATVRSFMWDLLR